MRIVVVVVALMLAGCMASEPDVAQGDGEITIAKPGQPASGSGAESIEALRISDERGVWEPSGAIDPTDSDHYVIAYRSADHRSMSVRATFDGGATWESSIVPVSGSAGPTSEWDHNGDAVVFFSPAGDLFIGGIAGPSSDPPAGADSIRHGRSIFIVKSGDGGRTFSDPILVAAGGGTVTTSGNVEQWDDFKNQDRPWFAAGPGGAVLAAWNELGHDGQRTVINGQSTVPYDGNEFQYAVSRDGGATWTEPVTLNHGGWPGALIRSDGTFVLGHSSHLNYRLTIYTSDDGIDWSPTELGVGQDQPDIQEMGRDLIIGTSGVLDGDKLPAYYRIGDETVGPYMFATGQDLNPFTNIAVDPSGGFWASWHGENGTINLARFDDPSSPWPTERHVIADIDPRLGAYGDYVDSLGVGDRLYVAWNDYAGDAPDDKAIFVRTFA